MVALSSAPPTPRRRAMEADDYDEHAANYRRDLARFGPRTARQRQAAHRVPKIRGGTMRWRCCVD